MNLERKRSEPLAREYLVNGDIVSPSTNEIIHNDEVVRIEPKSMEVLVYLFDHAGQVVSREQILDAIWDTVTVGDDSLTNAIIKIRRAFGDDARAPKVVETIPKRGYRLIAEVVVVAENEPVAKTNSKATFAVLAALAVSLLAVGFWVFETDSIPPTELSAPTDNRTRIAVAPFLNLSGDAAQEYLAKGIEQTILTELTAHPQIVAIEDSNGATAANYRLEGSVRRNGDRIRVDTRLLDARDGTILASQRHDRDFSDLIAVETEIETTILQALTLDIDQANLAKESHGYTDNIQAYDLFLQAQAALLRRDQAGNINARALYLRAIERDPRFARAYAGLALVYAADYRNGWAPDETGTLERALSLATTALEIEPNLPEQYWVIGYVHTQQRQLDSGEEALQNALRLDPEYADAFALLGGIQTYAGRPEKTVPLLNQAMRLKPQAGYLYFLLLGRAYYFLEDCPLALINLTEAASRNPSNLETHLYLAACQAKLGNLEDAVWEVEEIHGIDAEFSLATFFKSYPMVAETQIDALMRDLLLAGAI